MEYNWGDRLSRGKECKCACMCAQVHVCKCVCTVGITARPWKMEDSHPMWFSAPKALWKELLSLSRHCPHVFLGIINGKQPTP